MNLLHSNAIISQCVKQTSNTGQKNALVHFYSLFSVSDYTGEVFITDTGLRVCVTQRFFIRLSQACIAFKQMTLSGSRFGARARLQKREGSGCSKRIYRFTLQNMLNGIILKITQSECDEMGRLRHAFQPSTHSVFSPGFALQINTSFSSLEDCTLARLRVPVTHDPTLSALQWKCTLRQKYKPGTFENTAHGSQSEKKGRGHTPCFSLRFHHYSRNRGKKKKTIHTSWVTNLL